MSRERERPGDFLEARSRSRFIDDFVAIGWARRPMRVDPETTSCPSESLQPAGRWDLCIHGAGVELYCGVDGIGPEVQRLARPFLASAATDAVSDGLSPVNGILQPFDEDTVLRRVSPRAKRVGPADPLCEVYQDGDNFWLVDDRWGMAEVNAIKGKWRSWVLPRPRTDAVRVLEMALLWPLAQVLRPRGLHLVPAVSITKDGFGILIIGSVGLELELSAAIRAGWRAVGQQWTIVREEQDKQLTMLHMPGVVLQAGGPPRLRSDPAARSPWIDLGKRFPRGSAQQAGCDMVILIEPSRRPRAFLRRISDPADAINLLRGQWPISELYPRLHVASKLARRCQSATVQLSSNPRDFVALIDSVRGVTPSAALHPEKIQWGPAMGKRMIFSSMPVAA